MPRMPRFHFISGLPRSGSTLLSALFLQNPRFHAGMTSPVGSFVNAILSNVSAGSEFSRSVDHETRKDVLRGLFDSFYKKNHDKEIIFDTNRSWCTRLPMLLDIFPETKIIACVRNVAWIMDSIERLYRSNPYEHTLLFGGQMGKSNVYNRLELLAKHDQMVGYAWSALREAFYGEHAESLLVLDYELLTKAPHKVMPLIYDFLGETPFEHDFEHVQYDAEEFDAYLGVPGLHHVHSKVEFKARKSIIPPDLFEKYAKLSFWHDNQGSSAHIIAPSSPVLKDAN